MGNKLPEVPKDIIGEKSRAGESVADPSVAKSGTDTRKQIDATLDPELAKDFAEYQAHRGIMNAAEYQAVVEHRYSQDDYGKAMKFLMPFGLPDHAQVEMTARMMGAMKGNPKFANEMVFMPEMYILMKQY